MFAATQNEKCKQYKYKAHTVQIRDAGLFLESQNDECRLD